MIILQIILLCVFCLLVLAIILRLFTSLPKNTNRLASSAFTDTQDTILGRAIQKERTGHGEKSGIYLLEDGYNAFAARILLSRAAERCIDVQYYIWHNDLSGSLLLEAMRSAADRGVRIRMLLDDNGITGMDENLAALNNHPNVEVRLYNPFVLRKPKMLGYLSDFLRLNRRMHNKSFTVDNQACIVGGRNIGDEYFNAREHGRFADLDALAIGPVAHETSREFDRYWSSSMAYPADVILPQVAPDRLSQIEANANRIAQSPAAQQYIKAVGSLPFIEKIIDNTLAWEWAPVELMCDDPIKSVGKAKKDQLLSNMLMQIIGQTQKHIDLSSPYLIPTAAGVRALQKLRDKGVTITVLTNSFTANDVWVVHAGYAHWRKALLQAGIRIFELKGQPPVLPATNTDQQPKQPKQRKALIGTGSGKGTAFRPSTGKVLRSSASTLHAKTFSLDGKELFIGSFNFDPRSMHLNTELGFVIQNEKLAARIHEEFENTIPFHSYEVILDENGKMIWLERELEDADMDDVIIHQKEPETTHLQRIGLKVLSHLPIEWLL